MYWRKRCVLFLLDDMFYTCLLSPLVQIFKFNIYSLIFCWDNLAIAKRGVLKPPCYYYIIAYFPHLICQQLFNICRLGIGIYINICWVGIYVGCRCIYLLYLLYKLILLSLYIIIIFLLLPVLSSTDYVGLFIVSLLCAHNSA